jgi:uncharacterized protein YcbK (DUF882 family)
VTTFRHFTREEFACHGTDCCGGDNKIEDSFVELLDELREQCGFKLPVTSGYRCPIHNQRVSSTGANGPHTTGRAADLGVSRQRAHRVLELALKMGFTGIGLNQKGEGRFVHLDDLPDAPRQPRPTTWTY